MHPFRLGEARKDPAAAPGRGSLKTPLSGTGDESPPPVHLRSAPDGHPLGVWVCHLPGPRGAAPQGVLLRDARGAASAVRRPEVPPAGANPLHLRGPVWARLPRLCDALPRPLSRRPPGVSSKSAPAKGRPRLTRPWPPRGHGAGFWTPPEVRLRPHEPFHFAAASDARPGAFRAPRASWIPVPAHPCQPPRVHALHGLGAGRRPRRVLRPEAEPPGLAKQPDQEKVRQKVPARRETLCS